MSKMVNVFDSSINNIINVLNSDSEDVLPLSNIQWNKSKS